MSRITKHRDAPYWVHSAPDVGPVEPTSTTVDEAALFAAAAAGCPGPCNRVWRDRKDRVDRFGPIRAAKLLLDQGPEHPDGLDEKVLRRGLAVVGQPVWCRDCADTIRVATGRLPEIAASAGARRDGQLAPAPRAERHGTAVAPPSPSPGWDTVDDVITWAVTWAETVADYLANSGREYRIEFGRLDEDREIGWKVYTDHAVPQPVPTVDRTLTSCAAFLQHRMTAVLSAPFAKDYGLELTSLVRRSEKVAGVDDLVHHLPLPCLQCDRKALQRKDGKDLIVCKACKASWTQESYDRLSVAFRHSQERRKA